MANLLEMDVGQLLASLKGLGKKEGSVGKAGGPSNPHTKNIAIAAGLVLALLAYVFFIYLPQQKELDDKNFKISQIETMRQEIITLQQEKMLEAENLNKANARYKELTSLFHTEQELEDLYRHISTIALTNGLVIANLKKGEEEAVAEVASEQTDDPNAQGMDPGMQAGMEPPPPIESMGIEGEEGEKAKKIAFYKIPMYVEINGSYLKYVKFRESLATIQKLVNIDKENINVIADSKGKVSIKATLSTFRMPGSPADKKKGI